MAYTITYKKFKFKNPLVLPVPKELSGTYKIRLECQNLQFNNIFKIFNSPDFESQIFNYTKTNKLYIDYDEQRIDAKITLDISKIECANPKVTDPIFIIHIYDNYY